MRASTAMTLKRVTNKIPGNQHIMVRDYLSGVHYADGTANEINEKVLDNRRELKMSNVYGISIEGNNIIAIDVLIEE
ncbi:hypothetical protein [Hydrogenoanaerobacterium sp.]|uniref:hypothetical protein n=1 Tax=Hydrogenoanaerobacterium sp. TaxID=2953763 RepID=UPI002897FD93|nr:hypothetical protein [Hydrogenoanaerobacterium sp.]